MDAHIIVLKGQSTHFIEKKRRPHESWERISIILGILKAHHEACIISNSDWNYIKMRLQPKEPSGGLFLKGAQLKCQYKAAFTKPIFPVLHNQERHGKCPSPLTFLLRCFLFTPHTNPSSTLGAMEINSFLAFQLCHDSFLWEPAILAIPKLCACMKVCI